VLEQLVEELNGEQTLLRADVDFLHPNGGLLLNVAVPIAIDK
jgi:hypothetical protein